LCPCSHSRVHRTHRALPPFPTRRSSDLIPGTDICLRVGGYLRADYYVHTGEGTGYAPIYDSIGSDLVFGREDNKFRTRGRGAVRSEEHTSELQSRENLVCRLLLEKKKRR